MRHLIFIAIVLVIIMSACNAATPEPSATAFMTSTASADEMTQGATLRLTLPASFTPTFTPSITATPTATNTPTATATATIVPEDVLCEEFIASPTVTEDGTYAPDDLEDEILIYLPYNDAIVSVEISNADTGEVLDTGTVTGYFPVYLDLSPEIYPEIGNYEWVMTVEKDGRPGLCERTGTFDTREDELPGFESTAEVTAEAMSEATAEVTVEVTAETTSEPRDGIVITVPTEIIPENTEETADNRVPFPPR